MDDAIARYRTASEANDIDAMMATLAPDIELHSPIIARAVFRGTEDCRILLTAVYGSLRGLKWGEQLDGDGTHLVIGQGRIGRVHVGDAMVFDLDPNGQIRRIRPHLRPWLALTTFALVVAPKLLPHPGVILRALRRS
jgi:hypothetical protein